jgi:hypothetical protein
VVDPVELIVLRSSQITPRPLARAAQPLDLETPQRQERLREILETRAALLSGRRRVSSLISIYEHARRPSDLDVKAEPVSDG